ncbi:hypothetical protein JST99_00320 [Candidatus Dependentiae bacterium]|nr:hypothetical protein [Candidatus Dependentiae bacterium]
MKCLSRKALLVILSLGMPLAQASDTDSSPSKFKAVLGFVATATVLIAGKNVYNSFFRPANLEAVEKVYNEKTTNNKADLDSVIESCNRAKEEVSQSLKDAEKTYKEASQTNKRVYAELKAAKARSEPFEFKTFKKASDNFFSAQTAWQKAICDRGKVVAAQNAVINKANARFTDRLNKINKENEDALWRLEMQKKSWFCLAASIRRDGQFDRFIVAPRLRAFLSWR